MRLNLKAWWLSKPHRTITDECTASPYMKRWHLLRTPWFTLMLHYFLRSDFDRALHDHPWGFITFLLTSGYWEHTNAGGRRWKRRFSILRRPAAWIHRVEIKKPCWTLVLHFRQCREWGFYTPAGFVQWDKYDYAKNCQEGS